MSALSQFVKRFPLLIYFILAYTFAWAFYPLIKISAVYGVPGLFAPAVAAIIVCWLAGGRLSVNRLLGTLSVWRIHVIWYVMALGLPMALTLVVALLSRFFGADPALAFAPITPLALIFFVLVVGEEIGWRGFAQPQLENRFSPFVAAVFLGVVWGIWHLPNFFVPELPHSEIPLAAFVLYTVGFSVIAAWLVKSSRGSVLIATLFHGASNTFGFLTPSLDAATRWWLLGGVYCAAALVVTAVYGIRLSQVSSSENAAALAKGQA
jgi:membrane protease YdiL (CAAX protease family)